MIQRYDANGFPLPDVPDYNALNQNFGREANYATRGPVSAVSDLEALADRNKTVASVATSTDRTPANGKYVYDSATGQYIWVPAGTAAPVGLAASPAYMNQTRGNDGRDIDPKDQDRINAFMDAETAKDKALQAQENAEYGDKYAPVPDKFTQGQRIKEDLSFAKMFDPRNSFVAKGLQALFGTQNPNLVTVEDRTPVSVNSPIAATAAQQAADDAEANAISNANTSTVGMTGLPSGYNASTSYGGVNAPTAGTGGAGKPGETAVGSSAISSGITSSPTTDGLSTRSITGGGGTTVSTDAGMGAPNAGPQAADAQSAAPDNSSGRRDAGGDASGGGPGGRVICTHFYRKGEMDRDMWRADLEFTFKNLSPTTVRGYQYWAIPYVRLMRKSKLAEDIIRPLAFARAKELAYKMGKSPKGSVLGKVVRLVCEPLCFAVGLFVGEQNWQALWTPVKD
jgi:hypothetical protein